MGDPATPAAPAPADQAPPSSAYANLPAWDHAAGKALQVDADTLTERFMRGDLGVVADHKYPLLGADGDIYEVSGRDAAGAIKAGYRFAPREAVARAAAKAPGAAWRAAAEGAIEAVPGGTAMMVAAGADPVDIKARQEEHPVARMTGLGLGLVGGTALLGAAELPTLGTLVGGERVAAATAAALGEARAASLAGRMATAAAGAAPEGVVYGIGNLANEASLGDANFTAEAMLAHAGMGAFVGGALGGVGGGVAAALEGRAAARAVNKVLPASVRASEEAELAARAGVTKEAPEPWPAGMERGASPKGKAPPTPGAQTANDLLSDLRAQGKVFVKGRGWVTPAEADAAEGVTAPSIGEPPAATGRISGVEDTLPGVDTKAPTLLKTREGELEPPSGLAARDRTMTGEGLPPEPARPQLGAGRPDIFDMVQPKAGAESVVAGETPTGVVAREAGAESVAEVQAAKPPRGSTEAELEAWRKRLREAEVKGKQGQMSLNLSGAFGDMEAGTPGAVQGGNGMLNDFEGGVQRLPRPSPKDLTPEQKALWDHYQNFERKTPGAKQYGDTWMGGDAGPEAKAASAADGFKVEDIGGAPAEASAKGMPTWLKRAMMDAVAYKVAGPLGPIARRAAAAYLHSDQAAPIVAKAMAAVMRVGSHIDQNMAAFVAGGAKAATGPLARRAVTNATTAMLTAKNPEARRTALAARAAELSVPATPDGVSVPHPISTHLPNASTLLTSRVWAIQGQLMAAMPRIPSVRMDGRPNYALVQDGDIRRFAAVDAALQDPLHVAEMMSRGTLPHPAVLPALKQAYPGLYARMAQAATNALVATPSVPYATAVKLHVAFGLGGHATMAPAAIAAQQAAIGEPSQPQAPSGAAPRPKTPKPPTPRGGPTELDRIMEK